MNSWNLSTSPLAEADDLDEILAWHEERIVLRNFTLRYDRMMLLLDPTPFTRELVGKKVEVVNYPDGRFGRHPLLGPASHRLDRASFA